MTGAPMQRVFSPRPRPPKAARPSFPLRLRTWMIWCLHLIVCGMVSVPAVFAQESAAPANQPNSTVSTSDDNSPRPFRTRILREYIIHSTGNGPVRSVEIQRGDQLAAGQVAFELDTRRNALVVQQAARMHELEFLEYRTSVRAEDRIQQALADAAKSGAAARYRGADESLRYQQVRTNSPGSVLEILVSPGDFVAVGTSMATLIDTSSLLVTVPVDSSKVELDQQVAVILGGKVTDGILRELTELPESLLVFEKAVENLSAAVIEIPNGEYQISTSEFAFLPQAPFCIIPQQAVRQTEEGQRYFTVRRIVTTEDEGSETETGDSGNGREETELVNLGFRDVTLLGDGQKLIVAPVKVGDVVLVIPEPGADGKTVEPQPVPAVIFPQTDTYPDVAKLTELLPDYVKSLEILRQSTGVGSAKAKSVTSLTFANPVSADLQGLFEPAQMVMQPLDEATVDKTNLFAVDELQATRLLHEEYSRRWETSKFMQESLVDFKDLASPEALLEYSEQAFAENVSYLSSELHELGGESQRALEAAAMRLLKSWSLTIPAFATKLELKPDQQARVAETFSAYKQQWSNILSQLLAEEIDRAEATTRLIAAREERRNKLLDIVGEEVFKNWEETQEKAPEKTKPGKSSTTGQPSKSGGEGADASAERSASDILKALRENRTEEAPGSIFDYLVYLIVGLMLLVILFAVSWQFKLHTKLPTVKLPSGGGGSAKSKKSKRPQRKTRVVEVGPEADYDHPVDAIEAIQAELLENEDHEWEQITFRITEGHFEDRLVIDQSFPLPVAIVAEMFGTVTWSGSDTRPVIELNGANDVLIQGIEFVAENSETAILVRDCQGRIEFDQVKITDIRQNGIKATARIGEGDFHLVVTQSELNSNMENAVGIFLDVPNYERSEIEISQCKFFGPLESGVRLRSSVHHAEIRESIFHDLMIGVAINNVEEPTESIRIVNNSFFELDRGITVKSLSSLGESHGRLECYNNLFSQIEEAEFVLIEFEQTAEIDEVQNILYELSMNNLTDREMEADWTQGYMGLSGLEEISVNDFEFLSTERESPSFLAPGSSSPHVSAKAVASSEKYIGAVPKM